jgi:N6-adenosine-specific RNA methylase IME4
MAKMESPGGGCGTPGALADDQLGEKVEGSDTPQTDSRQQKPRSHHALAQLFPRMSQLEFDELCVSIETNGQREDITTLNGEVLDGVNREAACIAIGIVPRYAELPSGQDPLRYVIDKNRVRRHLDDDQRRMVAAKIAQLGRGRRDPNLSNGEIWSRAEAAGLMSVDIQGVDRAKVILNRGTEELQKAVEERRATVRSAAQVATLPREKQHEILREIAANPDGKRALKQVAKQVRAADQKSKHTERQQKLESIATRNPDLPCGRLYSFVLIDVPRHHNVYSDDTGSEKAPENHYPTMSFKELIDFDIDSFAAPDAIIAYWSTTASLLDDIEILTEWGFITLRIRDSSGFLVRGAEGKTIEPKRIDVPRGCYASHQIWRKQRPGKQTGTGRWFWDQHEILILCRRGNPPAPLPGTQDQSVFDAPIGAHSEKPHNHVRAWIDRCWPEIEKIEVFARGNAPKGWMFWGNQAENFVVHHNDVAALNLKSLPSTSSLQPEDDPFYIPDFRLRSQPSCAAAGKARQ